VLLYAEDRRELTDDVLRLTGAEAPALRARAALAIGRVGLPIGAPRLMELLRDPEPSVRALAAFGLGLLELDLEPATSQAARRRITEKLLPLLHDPSPVVVEQALWSLGVRADRLALAAVDGILGADRPAPVLIAALGAWWRIPEASPAPAARLLRAPDPDVRHAAATALRRLNDPDAMPMLEPALADPDPLVKAAVVRGLRQAPPAAARRHLTGLLGDDSWRVVSAALGWTLVLWRDGAVIEDDVLSAVIAASLAHDRHVQRLAFEALAVAAPHFSVPEDRLVHALRTGDPTTRLAVVDAFAAAGGDGLDEVLGEILTVYGIDAPPAEPSAATIPEMLSASPLEAAAVVRAIGVSDTDDADDWLRIFARYGPEAARAEALRHLQADDPQEGALLAAAWLEGGTPVLRAAAAQAIELARASGTLAPRAPDQDDWTTLLWGAQRELGEAGFSEPRAMVLGTLLSIDPENMARRAVVLLSDEDRVVRLWAVRNLAPARGPDGSVLVAEAIGPVETGRTMEDYRGLAAEILDLQALRPRLEVASQRGDFVWELRLDWAPLTGVAFLDWVAAGFFDDIVFHRVVPDFVIQAGDPTALGYGGAPGSLRNEETPVPYAAGTVGLALAGRDTGGSQFFIVQSPQPHLAGLYPVLGKVTSGGRVIDRIQPGDRLRISLLARISHRRSAAGAGRRVSTALRLVGLLNVLSSTPASPSLRAPCIHAPLRALATNGDEICGLESMAP